MDEFVCQIPASGVTVTIDGVEYVTDESGEVTVDRTENRVVVTLGDDRWYAFCDP